MINDIGAAVTDVCGSDATINDLAANPRTGTTFLSATTKEGPAICRIDTAGKLSLDDIPFASVTLPDSPEDKLVGRGRRKRNPRNDAITDIAFYEGRVLVSGLRSGDAPSSVCEFSFPFSSIDRGTGIAIYHAAHGKEEDYSAARTFVTLNDRRGTEFIGRIYMHSACKNSTWRITGGTRQRARNDRCRAWQLESTFGYD